MCKHSSKWFLKVWSLRHFIIIILYCYSQTLFLMSCIWIFIWNVKKHDSLWVLLNSFALKFPRSSVLNNGLLPYGHWQAPAGSFQASSYPLTHCVKQRQFWLIESKARTCIGIVPMHMCGLIDLWETGNTSQQWTSCELVFYARKKLDLGQRVFHHYFCGDQ